MGVLGALGVATGIAQNQGVEPVVQTTHIQMSGAGKPAPSIKATVKDVQRHDKGFTVTFQGERGEAITKHFNGVTGAALDRALKEHALGSVHEMKYDVPGWEQQLRSGGPFRGLVHKDTSQFFGVLSITDFQGRQRAWSEFGPMVPAMDPVLGALLKHLEHGKVYEFPHALDVALAGGVKPSAQPGKQAARDALLSLYHGIWEGEIHKMPGSRILTQYIWNEEATALWREMTFWRDRNQTAPPQKSAVLIGYDADRKAYAERIPSDLQAEPLWLEWDPKTRQLTSKAEDAFSGEKRSNKATFVTDDRIEWTTITEAPGKAAVTSSGYYERVRL